jgi:EAL domain-containing protein (putative c-di-GMP-specific phosphodiesterase class I)
MADKLQLDVLVEGVETKEQVDLLKNIDCDQVQGYYYAKPMPEEEFFELLTEQNR